MVAEILVDPVGLDRQLAGKAELTAAEVDIADGPALALRFPFGA